MCRRKGFDGVLSKGLALLLCAALALAGFPISARAEGSTPAGGEWGECSWYFDGYTLHVWPSNGTSGMLANFGGDLPNPNVPWLDVASQIEYLDVQRGVMLPEDCGYMLYGCYSLSDFDASQWDTSNVVNMRGMFENCSRLRKLNVRDWNTSNVTDMQDMFKDCWTLGAIIKSDETNKDVFYPSEWDTSQVTNMSGMFSGCNSIPILDLSHWNTSRVTDMSGMFNLCSSLGSLDVSTWNTSSVTSMRETFQGCIALYALDISNWNTSSVTDMCRMFASCQGFPVMNISKWDTSSVTDMEEMFAKCSSLWMLDLSTWNTSSVENMQRMFADCSSLFTLNVSDWDTASVTDMNGMFSGCTYLNPLEISGWNTSSVTDMNGMFSYCQSLYSLSVPNWQTSSVEDMSNMFYNCDSLESLDASNWDTSSVVYMDNMFSYCNALHSLDLTSWDTSQVESMNSMFQGCTLLDYLDVSTWDTTAVGGMWRMFKGCDFLTSLDLSSWDTSSVEDMEEMFADCTQLNTITVSGLWNTDSVYYSDDMFYNCYSIVGGNGTVYDEDYLDAEYARIDMPGSAGYLTLNPDEALEPSFETVNLTIGQQYGLTYWLNLPKLSWLNYEDSYIEFHIDDKAERTVVVELTDDTQRDSKGRYGFTFDLSSIEMAEPVSATFYFEENGEERSIELSYTMQKYFSDFDAKADDFSPETIQLVHATANMGYYMQPYLTACNDWVFFDDYEPMTDFYGSPDVEAARAGLSAFGLSGSIKNSGLKNVGAMISFDSLTAVSFYLTPENASSQLAAQASFLGGTYPGEKQNDGRWLVQVAGIKPQDFDKSVKVTGNGGTGDFTIETSALGIMNLYFASSDAIAQNAFAAAYEFWQAAQAY